MIRSTISYLFILHSTRLVWCSMMIWNPKLNSSMKRRVSWHTWRLLMILFRPLSLISNESFHTYRLYVAYHSSSTPWIVKSTINWEVNFGKKIKHSLPILDHSSVWIFLAFSTDLWKHSIGLINSLSMFLLCLVKLWVLEFKMVLVSFLILEVICFVFVPNFVYFKIWVIWLISLESKYPFVTFPRSRVQVPFLSSRNFSVVFPTF